MSRYRTGHCARRQPQCLVDKDYGLRPLVLSRLRQVDGFLEYALPIVDEVLLLGKVGLY